MNIRRLFLFIGVLICGFVIYHLVQIVDVLNDAEIISKISLLVLDSVGALFCCLTIRLLTFMFIDD